MHLFRFFIVCVGWSLVWFLKLFDPFLFPSPVAILKALFSQEGILIDVLATLKRVFYAFLFPVFIGVPTGIVLGAHQRIYRMVELIIDMGKSTAPISVFPLFLLFLGIGDTSKIVTAGVMSLFIVIFSIAYGVMHTKNSRILAAKIMGADKITILRSVVCFETLPHIFTGLRTGMSWVLLIILSVEMFVGTSVGLGHRIIDNQIIYNVPGVYAAIFTTALLGYFINLIFVFIEKKYLHWVGK